MSKDKRIIDFAQKLYSQYDEEGNKKHSFRSISKAIWKKYTNKVSYRTVKTWSDKNDWDEFNAKIKMEAIEKVKKSFTMEEELIEASSNKLAKDYKSAENLAAIGLNVILQAFKDNPKSISIRDALAAIRIGFDIKFRISDTGQEEASPKQVFTIGDQTIIF